MAAESAATQEGEELLEELSHPLTPEEEQAAAASYAKIEKEVAKLLRDQRRAAKKHARPTKHRKYLRLSVAAAISLMVVTLVGAFFTVDAVRYRVLRVVWSDNPRYSEIYVKDESQTPIFDDSWKGYYAPTYVPEGYRLSDLSMHNGNAMISYHLKNEETTLLFQQVSFTGGYATDTEGSTGVEVQLEDGTIARIVEKGALYFCYWHNDKFQFTLSGNVKEEELLKIVESVEVIE